jgi:hypothetical protein
MRLCMGLGYLHTSDSYQGQTETVSGPGVGMDMAFGAAVARNLLVFGDLSITMASEPTWKYAGTSDTLTNTTLTLLGMGPGIAYYLEPLNLYFSGSVQLSHVTLDNSSSSSDASQEVTDYGFGASFMAGKEWWVSSNWGLGAAALLHLASMKMKDFDTRMSATAFSILFSATFN